ncbi:MAG: hypothetical protein IH991_20790, partial [Planctomycetes bacterium]|nr:hypothetical protein [Planctomycetota bacterium]
MRFCPNHWNGDVKFKLAVLSTCVFAASLVDVRGDDAELRQGEAEIQRRSSFRQRQFAESQRQFAADQWNRCENDAEKRRQQFHEQEIREEEKDKERERTKLTSAASAWDRLIEQDLRSVAANHAKGTARIERSRESVRKQ